MYCFDCDCLLGIPKIPVPELAPDLPDLLAEMQRLGIQRALVRHRSCLEAPPEIGNIILMEEIEGQDDLVPVWHVTPDGVEGQFDPQVMVRQMLAAGVRVAWITFAGGGPTPPILDAWYAGDMLGSLQAHRVPLLVPYNEVPTSVLRGVLTEFPRLPIVLLDHFPPFGRDAILYALMKLHGNLMVCTSSLCRMHYGIEDLCRHVGSERIVFGSGYPDREGGSSLAALTYARLTPAEKEAIAHRNVERLLGEVQP